MHNLGHTRSVYRRDHLLLTPDTFVRAPLPGMVKATAVVHVAPTTGAKFMHYTAEMEEGGCLGVQVGQRFLFVLQGSVNVEGHVLETGGYAYLPSAEHPVVGLSAARVAVIEKPYVALRGKERPGVFVGAEPDVAPKALGGDEWLEVRALLPDDTAFDFAVNTMTYQPGASLPMVEVHVMEHGLLMLEGGGVYRLGDYWYPTQAGDFIWMASYCPQWFCAVGKAPAKYLIYKDWNRHPLGV